MVDQGDINVATWNVLTLNQPGSKLLLAKELQKYKVTIAGITETHPSADCEEYIGEVRTLVWRSPEMRRCCAARKSLLSFAPVKPRLLRARFDSKHGRINIITCYALTNETEEEDKSDFYTLLSFELSSVPPHDYLILLGDMNNSISNESGMWDFAVGPVTVDSLSDNRVRMLNCCLAHSLTVANTRFQRLNLAMYTWYSNDESTKKMLDYIVIRRR
ncbi:craniofacial development protein 2-like [Artemia franciscana]|uniref:craniofacial development protein 2-like n=1 Tax=Artemia franciscana TaxID=6661 RepID=UPI0032DA17CC